MYKVQITDGEQIECASYDLGEKGVQLSEDDGEFLAFVPYDHLLWVASVDESGRVRW